MATIISHAITAAGLAALFPRQSLRLRVWVAGAVFAMLPDADVLSFRVGIAYGDLFGHRGFTHSLVFAAAVAAIGTLALLPKSRIGVQRGFVYAYLFLATASHAVLDALTNGGYGVAFFAPFDNTRYFFPFTPVEVSPIGIASFFTQRGAEVLWSEMQWIWLPLAAAVAATWLMRAARRQEV